MLVALPHLLSLRKLASSSAAGCLENISSAKLIDCIMFQDLTRTHGNIPFVKCIKIKKKERFHTVTWLFKALWFYEMKVLFLQADVGILL